MALKLSMSTLQLKAVLLIAMLAGHEAARINDAATLMTALNESTSVQDRDYERSPAEETYKELNRQCSWSILDWGCAGEGCAYRHLSLDWPPPSSQSCRHTDAWMMNNDGVENFKTVVGVLEAKSQKYADKCKGATVFNRYCARRQQQMMRAMKFISKAEANKELMDAMGPEDKAEQAQRFDAVFGNVAGSLGEDGALIREYAEKWKTDSSFQKDPRSAVQSIIQTIVKCMDGSDEEKAAAREEMQSFEPSPPLTEEEKETVAEANNRLAEDLSGETDALADVIDNVDELCPDNVGDGDEDSQTNTTSMLQVRSGSWAAVGIATVLMALLAVSAIIWVVAELIAAIITWAVLALFGCGVYTAGHDHAITSVDHSVGGSRGHVDKMGFTGFAKCFVKAFAIPFMLVGKAAVATYKFFRHVDDDDDDDDDSRRKKKDYD